MPFFIQWDVPPEQHPGRTPVVHRTRRPQGIAWIEISGDSDRLARWLGLSDLPIRFAPGPPGLLAVAVRIGDDERVLRG